MPGPLADLRVWTARPAPRARGPRDCSLTTGRTSSGWSRPAGDRSGRAEPLLPRCSTGASAASCWTSRIAADRSDASRLLATADVLFETTPPATAPPARPRPGTTLPPASRHLVHCSITAFGHDGPYRDLPGHEALVHALVGTMAEQAGHRDGPIYEAVPFATGGAAYLAAIGRSPRCTGGTRTATGDGSRPRCYDGALAYLAMFWGDDDVRRAPAARVPGRTGWCRALSAAPTTNTWASTPGRWAPSGAT